MRALLVGKWSLLTTRWWVLHVYSRSNEDRKVCQYRPWYQHIVSGVFLMEFFSLCALQNTAFVSLYHEIFLATEGVEKVTHACNHIKIPWAHLRWGEWAGRFTVVECGDKISLKGGGKPQYVKRWAVDFRAVRKIICRAQLQSASLVLSSFDFNNLSSQMDSVQVLLWQEMNINISVFDTR